MRGRPGPLRGMRIASSMAGSMVQSAVLPLLSTIGTERPRPSTARWTLVVSPPLDRPSASRHTTAAKSSNSPPASSSFCGHQRRAGRRGHPWSRSRRSTPRCPPRHRGPGLPPGVRPDTILLPPGETPVDGLPGPVTETVDHATAHPSATARAPRSPPGGGPGRGGLHRHASAATSLFATRRVCQLSSPHNKINYETRPRPVPAGRGRGERTHTSAPGGRPRWRGRSAGRMTTAACRRLSRTRGHIRCSRRWPPERAVLRVRNRRPRGPAL